LNAGLGCELLWFGGRARTSVVLGSSMLLTDTFLLDEGEVGVFFEARPLGLRWAVSDHVYIILDPLTFALVAPEPSGDGKLVMREYRTLFGVEVAL
jgi:hypothetical protein